MLQITAYLPGLGEVPLLAAPSLAEAAAVMNGQGADAEWGSESDFGRSDRGAVGGKDLRDGVSG